MADSDSDSNSSAGGADIETSVLLGYASKEPTADDFSQLGGRPTWIDGKTAPDGAFARCKVCNSFISLLLQLHADLSDWFPGHERRLYVFSCKRKACRRKNGSIRALRAVRHYETGNVTSGESKEEGGPRKTEPSKNIGETLFGVKAPTPSQANPFASSATTTTASSNPFATEKQVVDPKTSSVNPHSSDDLPQTFAEKARIAPTPASKLTLPSEPWPDGPNPYPSYHIDAGKEYLELESDTIPANARIETEGGGSTAADEKALFESSMDRTFQRFADRLAQNPEQILRYEFAGQPLLYSKHDSVGKLFSTQLDGKVQLSVSRNGERRSRIPRCTSCSAERVFELQLTPHAISELEVDEEGITGMDWGTIIVGVCSQDCLEAGKEEGEVGYLEEWVGIQWEEVVDGKKR